MSFLAVRAEGSIYRNRLSVFITKWRIYFRPVAVAIPFNTFENYRIMSFYGGRVLKKSPAEHLA